MSLHHEILKLANSDPQFARELARQLRYQTAAARALNLMDWGLEGLMDGRPVTLYHGTTASFRVFDLSKTRDELVNQYYGRGIFLVPSKRVAEKYANANRNIGFPPEIIDDLRGKNPNAGAFLQALYDHGRDAWELYFPDGGMDLEALEKQLRVDPNDLLDLSGYILGSKKEPPSSDNASELFNLFNQSTGAPDWVYDLLDKVGLNSEVYRPKVYTVTVTASNTLVTANKAQARQAQRKGYDAVVFYGADLVDRVPEVAVFDPRRVHITRVDVV